MESKMLRSFIAVVDSASFTKAAEKTYTSQPTVSAHIKALEEELGVQLIARDTKNLRVTQKGRELYDCACQMLALQQNMLEKWAGEEQKGIRIGVSTIPSDYILPAMLEAFCKERPDVPVSIHQSDSEEIEEAVEKGAFDLGIVGEKPGGGLESTPVAEDKTVVIAPNTEEYRRLLKKKDWKKLLAHPILFREKGSASRKSAELLLEKLGFDPKELNVAASLNDQEAIKNLVEHGFGISFVSALAAEDRVKDGRLLSLETGLPEAKRTFYLIRRKNTKLSESAEAFARSILS